MVSSAVPLRTVAYPTQITAGILDVFMRLVMSFSLSNTLPNIILMHYTFQRHTLIN